MSRIIACKDGKLVSHVRKINCKNCGGRGYTIQFDGDNSMLFTL